MSNINTVGKLIDELSKLDKEAPIKIEDVGGNFIYDIMRIDYYSGDCVILIDEDYRDVNE